MIAIGPRLLLRPPRTGDQEAWATLRRESATHLLPWEPAPASGDDPCGARAFERFLEGSQAERHLKTLVFRREDEALVGQVCLNEIVHGAFRSAYLGYWVGAPFLRRGFAVEAVGLMIDHAFDELGLHRVEANVQPTNSASLALVRRLGFRREGFSPRYLEIAGAWADHERWALTVEDQRSQESRNRTRAAAGLETGSFGVSKTQGPRLAASAPRETSSSRTEER